MRPLRIAFVSSYPPMPCGIGIYVRDLARALVRRGHEVHVVAAQWEGAPREEVDRGVHVHRTWVRGSERFHHQIVETFEELGPFDVIEVQYEYGLWPIVPLDSRGFWLLEKLKEYAGLLVSTLHTVRYRKDETWIKRHKNLINLNDLIIVHHFIMENALFRMLGELEKVEIVPHGSASLPGKRVELEYERPTLLLFGLMRKDKGLEDAVKALELLGKGTLIVAGRKLEGSKINEIKSKRVVRINKFLSDEELGTLIRSVDYVIFPYRDLSEDFGISGALHTTIASEGKAICSRVQRLVECWERAPEVTFSPGDVKGLVRALKAPQDAFMRLWRYGELTSWDNVAKLRERLYIRYT